MKIAIKNKNNGRNNNTIHSLRASYKSGTILDICKNYTWSFQQQHKKGTISLCHMRNWSSQMLRNLLTITQKRNWRAGVQPLSYQALKSLLFRIRSAGKEFSIIQICCQAALSMPMEGWGWQLGQVHGVNKNLGNLHCEPLSQRCSMSHSSTQHQS